MTTQDDQALQNQLNRLYERESAILKLAGKPELAQLAHELSKVTQHQGTEKEHVVYSEQDKIVLTGEATLKIDLSPEQVTIGALNGVDQRYKNELAHLNHTVQAVRDKIEIPTGSNVAPKPSPNLGQSAEMHK